MKIKVLVVDDSAFIRKVISDMIMSDSRLEVIATAKNGEEAVLYAKKYNPDVITLDIEMPKMDGLSALKAIMAIKPVPVIMMSTLTTDGATETFKALNLGAFDFVAKPTSLFKVSSDDVKRELLEKIVAASKGKVRKSAFNFQHNIKSDNTGKNVFSSDKKQKLDFKGSPKFKKIIAIGTSTGGPRALHEVIPKLPSDIDASIVVVQHMPPGFTKSLADRLNTISNINVKEAEDGDIMLSGTAYIAPGDKHIKITKQLNDFVIKLDDSDKYNGHRPSVDFMYKSIVSLKEKNVVGVIMTGMGNDGATEMKQMKDVLGAVTIAQDENSCVVFGMPKAAINLGAVDKVVDLGNIASEIVKAVEV